MSTPVAMDNRAFTSIARFFHYWAASAMLPGLCHGGGAKLVTLAAPHGIDTRTAARGMAELVALGLARPNPGHGHPMRPEYLPTPKGRRVAAAWEHLRRALTQLGIKDAGFFKWRVPVLAMIGAGIDRFADLENGVEGLTPRALAHALRALAQARLIERDLEDGFPPSITYSLHSRARGLDRSLLVLISSIGN